MSAAAVIMIRRKRLIRKFREAGATDPGHAVTLESLGERRFWLFDHMVRAGVFLPTRDGRYYMDDQAASEFLDRQRMRALTAAVIGIFVLLALLAFGFFRH